MVEKKILFAASTRSHLVHFHLPYLRALREEGWTVHALYGGTQEEDLPQAERTIFVPLKKSIAAPDNFRAAVQVRKLGRAEGYQAIIVHTALAAFFVRLALLGLKHRPTVINMVHGYLFDHSTNPLKRQLLLSAERLTAPVTDLLLTMNREDLHLAQTHKLGRQIAFVPGVGVDFSRLDCDRATTRTAMRHRLSIPEDAFVLLYPAEFSSRKSQQVLLHALTLLPANFMLVLPGTGALLEECQVLAASLGLSEQVLFPGYVSDMGAWYAMADCAVSASRSEGLPFNIMEAMHCTLPVVASQVKGHCDLISHEQNGLLYPYGDRQACAHQLLRLAQNPNLAAALARQAHEDVARYALNAVFPQVMAAYHTALGEPSAANKLPTAP